MPWYMTEGKMPRPDLTVDHDAAVMPPLRPEQKKWCLATHMYARPWLQVAAMRLLARFPTS